MKLFRYITSAALFALAISSSALANEVKTDYDHHAGLLPYMTRSRLVAQEKAYKVVEQEGRLRILFWTFTMRIKQHVYEEPLDARRRAADHTGRW